MNITKREDRINKNDSENNEGDNNSRYNKRKLFNLIWSCNIEWRPTTKLVQRRDLT